jgi:two-component sensor histidine kinase
MSASSGDGAAPTETPHRQQHVGLRFALLYMCIVIAVSLVAAPYIEQWLNERSRLEHEIRSRAVAVETVLSRYMATLSRLALVFADSPAIQRGEYDAIYTWAMHSVAANDFSITSVVVHDREGRQVVNTYNRDNLQQERGSVNRELYEQVVRTMRPAFGLVRGRVVKDWLVVVMAPVLRDGKVAETVSVTVRAVDISNLIAPMMERPFSARLITKSGQIVMRTDHHDEFVGRQVVDGFVQAGFDDTRWRKEGTWRGASASGESVYAAYRRIDAADWVAVVSAPETDLAASWQLSLTFIVLLGLVLLVLLWVVHDLNTRIREAHAELKLAYEHERQESERYALLAGEYQHQIANTFTRMSATVSLSATRAQSKEDLAAGILERLAAETRLIKYEYEGGGLQELIEMFLAPHESGAHPVKLEGPEVTLGPKAMKDLGLVLHELATNAVKYGAFYGPDGMIHIRWEIQGSRLKLWWHEMCNHDVPRPTRAGYGSFLLEQLVVKQLRGERKIEYEPKGLCYIFTLPLESLSR